MVRDRFEAALDVLLSAHEHNVCSQIDARACGTRRDFQKAREAEHAYLGAREAFLEEVLASSLLEAEWLPLGADSETAEGAPTSSKG